MSWGLSKKTRHVAVTADGVIIFHRLDRTYRWGTTPDSTPLTEQEVKRFVSDNNHAACIGWALTFKGGE
ncbi:hypothetical protein J2045_003388 [Peteryoungia aggregata LMG 23059]|uniref:Uncharacterized protein n=1 Tax=Peteryoungia aggregata LMG 23059 TaxID=1368425 RepID=A0ABU0GAG3_9HYPH|nr:hypothetical protein [Peteryoungia aggregata]MDQ0422340.1 hypothetical protein [Peteryoungia aggregata LMG 23059]